MVLLKLNATDSTNSYLRQLSKTENLEKWTVVTAEYQTQGRGQKGAVWESEKSKNLICSILVKFSDFKAKDQFVINYAVSLGIQKALLKYNLPKLKVKWPNDIMSVSKKLGGILIENTLLNNKISQTIIGIGLNVNQLNFSEDLPLAISMKQVLKTETDLEELLKVLLNSIQEQFELVFNNQFETLRKDYEECLFRKDVPFMYQDLNKHKFIGVIRGINNQGMLMVEKEDASISTYQFKEISYL